MISVGRLTFVLVSLCTYDHPAIHAITCAKQTPPCRWLSCNHHDESSYSYSSWHYSRDSHHQYHRHQLCCCWRDNHLALKSTSSAVVASRRQHRQHKLCCIQCPCCAATFIKLLTLQVSYTRNGQATPCFHHSTKQQRQEARGDFARPL